MQEIDVKKPLTPRIKTLKSVFFIKEMKISLRKVFNKKVVNKYAKLFKSK